MRWPWSPKAPGKPQEPRGAPGERFVDFDAPSVDLTDTEDPTALLLQVTMEQGYTLCSYDAEHRGWLVTTKTGRYSAPTQIGALRSALEAHRG